MPSRKKKQELASDIQQLDLFSLVPNYKFEEIKEADDICQPVENSFNSSACLLNFRDQSINDLETQTSIDDINGLTYVRNFITETEHNLLLYNIDTQPWLTDLKRRVQHYGYKYDYAKHKINSAMYIAPLPDWALKLAINLHQRYSPTLPDQLIVNEYEPGQGIANHTDCKTCFRDPIISLSLGSKCVMDFTHKNLNLKKSILLEPRSLIIMQDEARNDWMHGIPKRKTDKFKEQVFKRIRRVSLTFRTVIIPK
ncbi:MAG: alpha-ketoglutarate-dependent dioxygenase AlkB [Nostoc sp.]